MRPFVFTVVRITAASEGFLGSYRDRRPRSSSGRRHCLFHVEGMAPLVAQLLDVNDLHHFIQAGDWVIAWGRCSIHVS